MPKVTSQRLLNRGVWLLVVGVFTSWLFGIGLLFILASAVCGFIGLFRDRVLQSALLLLSASLAGFFCLHLAAVAGIYAFNSIRSNRPAVTIPASAQHP